MNPHETDRRHIERQIAYARPITVLMTLIALLQQPSSQHANRPISFLIGYLILSFCAILFEKIFPNRTWHLPLFVDLVALVKVGAALGVDETHAEAHFGMNRRFKNPNGSYSIKDNPEGLVNPDVTILRVDDEAGKRLAKV